MIKRIFVDTAGWMALADANDPHHSSSVQARDGHLKRGGTLLTTDYVVDETLTLIRMRISLHAAERWWRQVSASPRVRWEWIGPERAEKARDWFFRWTDQSRAF